jgi:hypothetical protein
MIIEQNTVVAELNTSVEVHESTTSRNPQIQQSNNPPSVPPSAPNSRPSVDGSLLLNDLQSLIQRFVVLPAFAPETLALWILHTYAFELRDVSTYLGIESPEKRCGKTTLLSVLSRLANRPVAAANISPSAFFRVIEEMRPTLLIDEADTFLRGNDELRGILNAGYTRDTAYVVRVTQTENPKGIPSFSPGLRGTSYPWIEATKVHNPERVAPPSSEHLPPQNSSIRASNSSFDSSASPDTRPSSLLHFSCWCPKVMAAIGRLPALADR